MKKNISLAFLAFALLFSACSTDLDVTGDWKETMVIYGLLDQSNDTQYVKINRAFLGQGNALEYAQIQDSVQFVNSLTVQIQKRSNSTGLAVGAPIILTPTSTIPKDAGVFYSADQTYAIYSFPSSGSNFLSSSNYYELSVLNNETGTTATSSTVVIDSVIISKPLGVSPFYFVNTLSANYPFLVEWKSKPNARLYQLNIRLNYMDYFDTNGDLVADDSALMHLDWLFSPHKTTALGGGETFSENFVGKNFIKNIAANLNVPANLLYRKTLKTDLIVTGGADDLSTFIDVNRPSTGIIQEKPEFTNITNGMGIFSSRSTSVMSRVLDQTTLDTLAHGWNTSHLKFLDHL